jgi:hypothetical protein
MHICLLPGDSTARTRIFIMYDHLNSGLMGYNYYNVPSYPMNVRMFRYGLAWTFYD